MEEGSQVSLSAIIINYQGRDFLPRALSSLEAELARLELRSEIILVDNASTDGSLSVVREKFPSVKVIQLSENCGFARAANIGAAQSRGDWLFFLNNDVELLPDCLQPLITFLSEHEAYAIAAPGVFNPDQSFQLSFGRDLGLMSEFFLKYLAQPWYKLVYQLRKERMERDVAWVSGVALVIRRPMFFAVGGFDERFFFYIEDADLGRRLRSRGFKIRYLPQARLIHYRGAVASRFPRLSLTEAKKSQLLYYSLYHGPVSQRLLRIYLWAQFRAKILWAGWRGDEDRKSIYSEVLRIVRSFGDASSA